MRRLSMPPPTLLLRRMEVQLLALLGELHAGADWGAITAEHHSGEPAVDRPRARGSRLLRAPHAPIAGRAELTAAESVVLPAAARDHPDGGPGELAYGQTMTSPTRHDPSTREILAELFSRLGRVQAAAGSLRSLTDMHSTPPAMLVDALHGLEHDLLLAAGEADNAAARMALGSAAAGG